jgi:hypothetical protein
VSYVANISSTSSCRDCVLTWAKFFILGALDDLNNAHKSPEVSKSKFMYSIRHFRTNRPRVEDVRSGRLILTGTGEERRVVR